jgi:hypothetical protein
MATEGPATKCCGNCGHECHCDEGPCMQPQGVGMSDKTSPCGCGMCECEKE